MTNDSEQESPEQTTEEFLLIYSTELGLIETNAMVEIRQLIKQTDNLDELKRLVTDYQVNGHEIVNKKTGQDFPRAQIGLIVASAGIYHSKGLLDEFREGVEDAVTYASNVGEIETANKLRSVLASN